MGKLLNLLRFRRHRLEQDLERELHYHVERRVQELSAAGVAEDEARRRALVEFGGVALAQEEVRDTWIWRRLLDLHDDVRYAGRVLLRSPGFTATAVVSLALGIGANTAMFSILHALVLRSLPVAEAERLVVVTRNNVSMPYPFFVHLRDQSQTLSGVLAFRTTPCRFNMGDATERITAALVSGGYFEVLGVAPAAGTTIGREDDVQPGSGGARGPVAVIGYGLWMRSFGGRSSAIGAQIRLNGQPFTVAGVAPRNFSGTEVGEAPDVYLPMTMQEAILPGLGHALQMRRSNWIRIIGRLKAGAGVRQAEAELTTLLRSYHEESLRGGDAQDPVRRRKLLEERIVLESGSAGISALRRQYAKPLWVLMAVMGLVLLIACTNVANLLLSRATVRRKEIAIRLGLGAARERLVCQFLTESLLLGMMGTGAGLLLARWLRDILTGYLPPERTLAVPIDGNTLGFTLALSVGAVLLFGLAPAFESWRFEIAPALKGEETAARKSRGFFRKGLIVIQMSFSCLLLIGAALFLRSLHNLVTVDPGFARENTMVASVDADARLVPRILEEVRYLPGVTSAGLADSPPLGTHTGWTIYAPGHTETASEDSPSVGFISPGYLETMRIPRLLGRDIDGRDVELRRNVMIVNETFARDFFPGENPIGRRVGKADGVYDWEIIGVVRDSRYSGLREGATRMVFVPYTPGPWASHMVIHARFAGAATGVAGAIRQVVHTLDPEAPVFDVHLVQEELDRSLLRERLVGFITGLFGGLALVLAGVGLYGLMAYGVSRRTREFGIRMAVGASAGSIVKLVLREAGWLVVAGVAAGLAGAWAAGRVVSSMLFGIAPTDLASTLAAVGVLAAAALIAAWVPARRASRVDPNRALRAE